MTEAADECSNPSQLYKARSAIRQIKADVKAMDVLIGAKSATLLGKQMGRQQAGEKSMIRALCLKLAQTLSCVRALFCIPVVTFPSFLFFIFGVPDFPVSLSLLSHLPSFPACTLLPACKHVYIPTFSSLKRLHPAPTSTNVRPQRGKQRRRQLAADGAGSTLEHPAAAAGEEAEGGGGAER